METSWFAVRCVLAGIPGSGDGQWYEERITLWNAASADVAITLAQAEARRYAAEWEASRVTALDFAQSYHLAGPPTQGGEVFSLIRDSDLEATTYLAAFFDTGMERQQ